MPAEHGIPSDETFVTRGRVDDIQSGGGGHGFAPSHSQILVNGTWYGLSNNAACLACPPPWLSQRSTGYARGSTVVISTVHGHNVVREVPAQG